MNKFIIPFQDLKIEDVPEVGGKNASLGEMIGTLSKKGVKIPGGFAVTATAYRHFLSETNLGDFIKEALKDLNTRNLHQLAQKGKLIREKIIQTDFPKDMEEAIILAHAKAEKKYGRDSDFAIRSSATAEDLPDASFAGEHETFLNVRGKADILKAVKAAMASLFTNRAISYRVDKHFDHLKIALSVGVQRMIRSDLACSGIMFTLDTETGFKEVVLINGSWGLGEMIVGGEVTPDEFLVFKKNLQGKYMPIINKTLGTKDRKMIYGKQTPTEIIPTTVQERTNYILSDEEILQLAKWAVIVENHYSQKYGKWTPMDLEWAKDGKTGELYIIQARPETVQSLKDTSVLKEYTLLEKGDLIAKGASVGNKIATGKARVISDPKDIHEFKEGEVLITRVTDPDWEPIMKIASAIITDQGGRTSHAAIVARELGIPAIVGTIDATGKIRTGTEITVDCSGESGLIFKGKLKFKVTEHSIKNLPKTRTHVMINIATPQTAFEKSFLPNSGVGLAREEFIIASDIGIHPLALINYKKLPKDLKGKIDAKIIGYENKEQFYIDKLAYGVAKISTSFYPHPVIIRFSDFKTNEYRTLLGGDLYEPKEENPMIGWRGASRYYHPEFAPAFILEIKAIKKVINEMGLSNTCVMVPFCRTPEEGKKVIEIMKKNGLSKKEVPSLKIYVMCEVPSNVLLADRFLDVFDGMSIGSNDLTQLTLGIDRDGNERIRSIANENDQSVKELISQIIKKCKSRGKYIGICGQAPSDYPEFTKFLVDEGIDSISLNPDSVVKTIPLIYAAEQI